MDSYLKQIAYDEGAEAYTDKLPPFDNPYEGVSDTLQRIWDDAWWDMFYEDN